MLDLLLAILLLSPFARPSASFYDNPDQDLYTPTGPDNAEELHQQWDFEVLSYYCISSSSYNINFDPQ